MLRHAPRQISRKRLDDVVPLGHLFVYLNASFAIAKADRDKVNRPTIALESNGVGRLRPMEFRCDHFAVCEGCIDAEPFVAVGNDVNHRRLSD